MKLLAVLFFAMLSSGLYAQSIIVNPDGTHSVVHEHGDNQVIVNPNGTHAVIMGSGTSKIMVNPDGTHSLIIGDGNSKIIVNPSGTHSILSKQGDFQQMTVRSNSANQPNIIKKRGGKMVILPDGSVIHFEKVKKKRKYKI